MSYLAVPNTTPTNTTDAYSQNTRVGLMMYLHGTTYNGGNAPTLTLTSGGGTLGTVFRSYCIPYQMADGSWRMKFSFRISCSSATRTTIGLSIAGFTSKNIATFQQAISGWCLNGGVSASAAYIEPNTSQFNIEHLSLATTGYVACGDIELNAKPTWAY